MKRVLVVLFLFIGFSVLGMAQTATKPAKKEVDKTKVVPAKKAAVPAKTAKMANTPTKTKEAVKTSPAAEKQKSTAAPVVLKKDGTPDKRYKTNKTPEGPLKKDGTPDKRYKSNKPVK